MLPDDGEGVGRDSAPTISAVHGVFDLREMPKGNGRVRRPVLVMTNASIRKMGVLHDEDPSMTPTL